MTRFGWLVSGLLLLSCGRPIAARAQPRDEKRANMKAGALTAIRLRCEYADAPMGIDTPHPRLSWELKAVAPQARGVRQSAYRLRVATSADRSHAVATVYHVGSGEYIFRVLAH